MGRKNPVMEVWAASSFGLGFRAGMLLGCLKIRSEFYLRDMNLGAETSEPSGLYNSSHVTIFLSQ